jgi:restriction endonuclease
VKATRPVVIIDGLHRVRRDSAGHKAVMALAPQVVIRFGAAFPMVREKGRGWKPSLH